MKPLVISLLLISLILTACESPLPSSNENNPGEAGPGIWVCLNQNSTQNAVIKKIGFDGKEMLTLPRCQQALDITLADASGSVWSSQLGIDGNYRIIKYSDSGEEILNFNQQDAGFFFVAQSLAPNPNDGSCWFITNYGALNHVCRLDSGGALLADNTEFDTPLEVAAATDGTCWVLDKSAMLVARLDADGNRMFDRSLTGHIPRSLAVDPMDGTCWVGYDAIIVKYNTMGEVLLQKELEYQINKIAIHPTSHSVCIQTGSDLVDEYDGFGNFGWRFYTGGTVSDIQITADAGVLIANSELHCIYMVSDAGMQEAAFGFAFSPVALAVFEIAG